MKKSIIFKSLIILFSIISFVSCETEPLDPNIDLDAFNPNNPNNNQSGSFTASIDGVNFVSTQTMGEYSDSSLGNELNVFGVTTEGKIISLQIINPSVGTFQASTNASNLVFFQYSDATLGTNGFFSSLNSSNNTSTGSVTITEFNTTTNKISATFSFTAYNTADPTNTKEVTQGVINNVSFTNQLTGGNPSTDLFFANVDGSEFVENQIDVAAVSSSGFPDAISIAASKSNGDVLSISIDEGTPVGTYPITGLLSTTDVVRGKYLVGGTLHGGVSGSLTITSLTATRIAGTFTFTAEDINQTSSHQITQGSFDVELP